MTQRQILLHPFGWYGINIRATLIQGGFQQTQAQRNCISLLKALDVKTYRGPCPCAAHKFQPLGYGVRIFIGQHFHGLSVLEPGRQWHFNLVDQYTCGMVTHAGVNGICEVQCRCVAAHIDNFAVGCENKYLIGKQV